MAPRRRCRRHRPCRSPWLLLRRRPTLLVLLRLLRLWLLLLRRRLLRLLLRLRLKALLQVRRQWRRL